MVSKRAIHQALAGFLGAYTSRNSEYDGYWLLGFLVACPNPWEIDLLQAPAGLRPDDPIEWAVTSARRTFHDQLEKARIDAHMLSSATLTLHTEGGGVVAGRPRVAIHFRASATVGGGRMFEHAVLVSAAAHDPTRESRSHGRW